MALIHGRGDRRYDLDGQPVGHVTPEEGPRPFGSSKPPPSAGKVSGRAGAGAQPAGGEAPAAAREIERRNREAKAARKAEHERREQAFAARHAALARGLTPESRPSQRAAWPAKRRPGLKASHAPRCRPSLRVGPRLRRPLPARLPEWAERPARTLDRAEPALTGRCRSVAFKKKRRVVPPPDEQ